MLMYSGDNSQTKAGVKRCTSQEPNGMQMRKILCSPSLAFDLAHVKYGVCPGPKPPDECYFLKGTKLSWK